MRQRSSSAGSTHCAAAIVALLVFAVAALSGLHAQTCDDWKAVTGWQGTYTLTSNGQFVHNQINRFTISETSGATVDMPNMTGGLCNQLRWQGPDAGNTGSVNDSAEILNGCVQGQWFTSDTLAGNSGYPSNSEIVVDFTDGTFSFQPIPHDFVTHTIYNCQGSQSGQESWATAPANNWPLSFPLPGQVGPLTITNQHFSAASRYAGYQDIDWTITFNLTPIFGNENTLTVSVQGGGSVASTDGFIQCPGTCSHAYPNNTQVTLNATPDPGNGFVTWSGACSGTGPCTVTMTQPRSVNGIFSPPLQFVAATPCRVIDTRNPVGQFGGPPLQGGSQRSFPIPQGGCNIPGTAAAYSLNITVVPRGSLGYLTVWPTGENQPVASTMNSLDGRVKANAAIVPTGTDGAISFYVTNTIDLVVDIDGYFASAANGTSQFFSLAPCRVIDTRNPNGQLGGPYLTGATPRDFPVQNSGCVPVFSTVGLLVGKANGSFQPEVSYPAGSPTGFVTVADLNGDGKPDVAAANGTAENVSVILGNGNGSFQAPALYSTGQFAYPNAVAAGDFNGDSKLDLAVTNYNNNNVSIFLGNGDGTFQAPVNYSSGITPRAIAVADFNGDGKLDLAIANDVGGSTVSILLGNGNGTFQAPVGYGTAPYPWSVVVDDFNGDGKLDLATANFESDNVSILLGNGNGTFQAATNFAAHDSPTWLSAADFNHDGKVDLAAANRGSGDVSVLLGNGNGSFQAAVNYAAGDWPWAVISGDFNGDNKLDLAVANSHSNNVSVLPGNGNGTFQAAVNYATGVDPESLAAADFNGDGKLDIVVGQKGASPTVISAYSLNVTAVPHTSHQPLGYVTVWPQGQTRPLVSTLNNPTGTVVANAAVVPAGTGGGISVYPSDDTDLVIDINGYFAAPAGNGLQLYPTAPCRVLDTRNNHGQPFSGERTVNVVGSPCAPPNSSEGFVFNATVVPPGSFGYLTLWPDGQVRPLVSTLNAPDGFITSNMAIVPTIDGSIDAYAQGLTHLVIDISSYFAP